MALRTDETASPPTVHAGGAGGWHSSDEEDDYDEQGGGGRSGGGGGGLSLADAMNWQAANKPKAEGENYGSFRKKK